MRHDIVRNSRDPRYWGMAKSFMMSGKQAGYDMATEKGIATYMEDYNRGLMGDAKSAPELEGRAREPRRREAGTGGEPFRNAPCPCGSGRKYKKCCGKKARS